MSYINKIFKIFSQEDKINFFIILILSTAGAFLEMIGISIFIPIITVLLGQRVNFDNSTFLNDYFDFISSMNNTDSINFLLLILIIIFLIKNSYLFFLHYYNNRFVNIFGSKISKKIFAKYLNKNINFFVKKNSNELLNNCIYVVDSIKDTLSILILIFSEILVLFGIAVLLIAIEPNGFLLSCFFIFFFGLLIFLFSNKVLERWGNLVIFFEKLRYLNLSQAFKSIREIKVFKKKFFFFNKYVEPNDNRFKIATWKATLIGLPRFIIELLFIVTLSILLIFLNSLGKSNEEILIIMGLYAVATIRIIPSLQRILSNIQSFKFGKKSIDIVFNEIYQDSFEEAINEKNSNNDSKPNNQKDVIIEFKNVFFKHEGSAKTLLKNINFKILKNNFIAIVGESGSGKSTIVDIMLGLSKIEKGEINLDYKKIGFVPQKPSFIDDSIKNNIAFGVENHLINKKKINYCINKVQLDDLIKNLPSGIETVVGENGVKFSGGETQRLSIARALYVDPDIIILDEPTNALDKITEEKIIQILKILSKDITIILVTHNLSNIRYCDRVIQINKHKNNILLKNNN